MGEDSKTPLILADVRTTKAWAEEMDQLIRSGNYTDGKLSLYLPRNETVISLAETLIGAVELLKEHVCTEDAKECIGCMNGSGYSCSEYAKARAFLDRLGE